MDIGKLRHRVIIQSPTDSITDSGSLTQTWATHATVWARVMQTGAGERMAADEVQSGTTAKIQIRKLSTVTAKMRVLDSTHSHTWNIEAIEADPKDAEYQWLHCRDVTP